MDVDRFTKDYVKGKKVTQSTVTILHPQLDSYEFETFRSLKGLIKYIDFNCQIDPKTGGCKDHPESSKCCCYNCLDNIGFLSMMLQSDLVYYSRHFSPKTGFWRSGKGCNLPHHMRSITCLTHHCNSQTKNNQYFGSGLFQVRNLMKDRRQRIRNIDDELHSRRR